MLKRLQIQNIILIENGVIPFEKGFNVLSGETGSGKSAILHALNLIVGERSDSSILRKGAEKGRVEAAFDLSNAQDLQRILEDAGIEYDPHEELFISREISSTGKSRAFINNQMVQLTLLKQVGSLLLEMVGQHANQTLLNVENHRQMVDLFGGLEEEVVHFAKNHALELELRKKYGSLLAHEEDRKKEFVLLTQDVEELENAQLKDGEEEELFKEYTLLIHAEERAHKTQEIRRALDLNLLNRQKTAFDHLVKIDQNLTETANVYTNALFELQEIAYVLDRYLTKIEANPNRLQEVNERLTFLNRLKKKFGSTVEELVRYCDDGKKRIMDFYKGSDDVEKLNEEIELLSKHNDELALNLTKKRLVAAEGLANSLMQELSQLNMTNALVSIDVTPQNRTQTGSDRVEFFLTPNVGERRIPLKESASGGELSRMLLALQTLLAGKALIPTLVFDEIDANIGGATASTIGEKLRQIGELHQVICVTHFPQVARFANHHLRISKKEKEGRTFTEVDLLSSKTLSEELARMQGNAS